jgi:hypothetical protein
MKEERREKLPEKSISSSTPTKGCSCVMKLERMSMTATHFSNSDNAHCRI